SRGDGAADADAGGTSTVLHHVKRIADPVVGDATAGVGDWPARGVDGLRRGTTCRRGVARIDADRAAVVNGDAATTRIGDCKAVSGYSSTVSCNWDPDVA